jgi:hypothetical protein
MSATAHVGSHFLQIADRLGRQSSALAAQQEIVSHQQS